MGSASAGPVHGVAAVIARSLNVVATACVLATTTIAPYFPSFSFVSPLFVEQSQHLALTASEKALTTAIRIPTSNIRSF